MYAGTHRYATCEQGRWSSKPRATDSGPGQYGTNIGITDDVGATLTNEQIARFEFGSKCLLAGWNFYVSLIWALKGCMLCFYNRITYDSTLLPFYVGNIEPGAPIT